MRRRHLRPSGSLREGLETGWAPVLNRGVASFFQSGDAPSKEYVLTRDTPLRAHIRALVERLWQRYEPLCPVSNFLEDARTHYAQRTWELWLACVLLDHRFGLERPGAKGPDLLWRMKGRRHWVEAIAVEAGSGADKVARPPPGQVIHFEHRTRMLRYTSGIAEKLRKHGGYLADDTVARDEPYVIALNAGAVPDADMFQEELPDIVKAVLPLGEPVWLVPIGSPGAPTRTKVPYRGDISKASGSTVSTGMFLDPAYAGVSGVMFSPRGIWNPCPRPGAEMIFVHNPRAANPLSNGFFRFGREYWVTEDGTRGMLYQEDWRLGWLRRLMRRWRSRLRSRT